MNKLIHRVRGLVERGERISSEDCRKLFDVHDLNEFSGLGRLVRERRYGLNAHFRVSETFRYHGEHPELFLSEIETLGPEDAVEFLLKVEWREGDDVASWQERFRAFAEVSLPVIISLPARFVLAAAESGGKSTREVLKEWGEILPVILSGHDALLFDEEWRNKHAGDSITAERWLALHEGAHEIGMKTEAGMVYHSSFDPDYYVAHLDLLRSLQDKTGGFRSFAPMAWHDNDAEVRYLASPSAALTLKTITISRLFLDNVPHITTSPGLTDPETSYIGLSYGADTIDPTLRPEDLQPSSGGREAGSGNELVVLSEGEVTEDKRLGLGMIEERIIEARFRPVPVIGSGEVLELVNKS